MAGVRLARIELGRVGWAVVAALLALGAGVLVGLAPKAAICIGAIAAAAALVARYPFVSLIAILVIRAALPNSVLIGFLTLGAGAVALAVAAPSLPGKRVVVPFLALLVIALASVPLLPSIDEGPPPGPLRLPLLGTEYAATPSTELLAWMNLASVLTVFSLAAWAVSTERRMNTLITAVLVSALVPITVALKQLAAGETVVRTGSTLKSLRGPFDYPNYFAFYLVVILVIGIVVLMETRAISVRVSLSALVAAAFVCLFLTYTRSAWIGFALALLTLALLRYRRLFAVAALIVVLAAIVAPGATHKAQQRFGDLTSRSEASDSNSWTWRVDQWNAILPYGWDKPITGQGFGSYSRVTVRHFGHFNRRYPTVQNPKLGVFSRMGFTAHNDYVRMFVEMGVPGLVLWVLVYLGVMSIAARGRSVRGLEPVATGMLALTIALAVISISDNLQGYTVVLMYAFAVCGALAGLAASSAKRRPQPLAAVAPAPLPAAELPLPEPETPPEPESEPEPDPTPEPPAEPARPTTASRGALERGRARLRGLIADGRRRRGGGGE
jgi:putative inorganic carbon (hco3(-)) transporter